MGQQAPVIVEPLLPGGGRPVRVRGDVLAVVHGPRELRHLLERLGWDTDSIVDVENSLLIEWHGGGVETW
jgi:hypothetical protein